MNQIQPDLSATRLAEIKSSALFNADLVPMILNAHAGTKYGISFPVYCPTAFGVHGANTWPGIMKALDEVGFTGPLITEQGGALEDLSKELDRIIAA